MNEIYVVAAHVDGNGIVMSEVFEDIDEALEYEKNGMDAQIREEYGDLMADHPSLETMFATRKLHKAK